MEEAVAIPLLAASTETIASTQSASHNPSQAEPAGAADVFGYVSSKSAEDNEQKTVEIRISVESESAVLKILSALKPQDGFPAPALPQNLNLRAPSRDEALAPVHKTDVKRHRSYISPLALVAALILGFVIRTQITQFRFPEAPTQLHASIKSLVDRIVASESQGNPVAKNPYSSAVGLGQFVEGTWLDLVRRHRPEIAGNLNEKQILDLRKDPELSRFMTSRYVEENSSILAKRGLPVTPGSLYLAHFAGAGGAAAILAAPEDADAATVIANVDNRSGVTREKILNGNPFMKNFTAKDLKNWAELKMHGLTLVEGDAKIAARRDL